MSPRQTGKRTWCERCQAPIDFIVHEMEDAEGMLCVVETDILVTCPGCRRAYRLFWEDGQLFSMEIRTS